MPKLLHKRRSAQPPPHAVLAAATSISQGQLRGTLATATNNGSRDWQDTGWQHYDICGELRFGVTWLGNALSRARLFAGYIDDNEDEPVAKEDGRPAELVAGIHGGQSGQSQMLQRIGVHLSVPGESFEVTFTEGGEQRWATLCSDEISEKAGKVVIQLDGEDVELPPDHHIIRVWRPHPRKHWEADSPVRGLLPVLHELERLTAHILAQAESRLAGAGLLLVPDNITFPVQDEEGNPTQGVGANEFLKVLVTAMVTPISNRDSASAVVPIVAQGPAEAIEAVKHLTFSTPLDEASMGLRQEAIRRLALGLDMPPEVLLGMADANHWSAWEISEAAVTQHIEPLLNVIAHGLTVGYLRPALRAEGHPEPERWVVTYDTSELVNRPNRGPDALALFERGELTGQALRREHGFGESDGPTIAERAQRELRTMLAQGATTLDQTRLVRLMEMLGFIRPGELDDLEPIEGSAEEPLVVPATRGDNPDQRRKAIPPRKPDAPDEVEVAPSAKSPGRPATRTAAAQQSHPHTVALQAVAQYAASAALDYAGKRLLASDRSFRSKYRDVPHHQLHTRIPVTTDGAYRVDMMLDGAFRTFEQIPELGSLRPVVEGHVRALLLSGRGLDRDWLNADVVRAMGAVTL